MKSDCYAILGVSPSAEDVVVRAAYLALMRRYHPDRDPSPEAAARARAVTEAYKTIGDPARRAEYDAHRSESLAVLEFPPEEVAGTRRRRLLPMASALTVTALALLAAVLVTPLIEPQPAGEPARSPSRPPAAPAEPPTMAETTAVMPTPEAALPPVADPQLEDEVEPVVPEPVASASPPPVAESPRPRPRAAPPRARPVANRPAATAGPAPAAESARLAAIERHSTLLFNQSVSHADPARQAQLQQARQRFLAARNVCKSDSCATEANLGHIRDVARIMESPGPSSL